jgi:hypothetical protein
MKSYTTLILLAVILFSGVAYAMQEQQNAVAIKGGVSYVVRPQYSRLLIFFKGPLNFTPELRGNVLIVSVSGIKSSVIKSGWKRQFHTGQIAHASLEPIVNGSSQVVVTLRDGCTRFQVTQHEQHEAIWIDVFPNTALASPNVAVAPATTRQRLEKLVSQMPAKQIPAQAVTKRGQENVPAREPVRQTLLIDIAGLARQQLDNSGPATQSSGEMVRGKNASSQHAVADLPAITSGKVPVVWLLLVCFSLLITMAVIALLAYHVGGWRRRVLQLQDAKAADAPPISIAHGLDDAAARVVAMKQAFDHHAFEEDRDAFEENREGANDGDDSPMLALAEQYHRNQGDIELTMKLRGGAQHHNYVGRAKTISATAVATNGRVSVAKKLGVGKGELDLATKLLHLSNAQKQKEMAE